MDTSRIPLKINDNLTDAFVEIYFSTDFSDKYLQNIMKNELNSVGWVLQFIPYVNSNGILTDKFFFTTGSVRFFLENGRVGINCVEKYPGWSRYQKAISKIIESIKGYVKYTEIHLKYVSLWHNIRIFDQIDGEVHLCQFQNRFNNTRLSFPAIYKNNDFEANAMVNLIENISIDKEKYSQIEVDLQANIIESETSSNDASSVNLMDTLNCLEEIHHAEKDMFFKLLKIDFIDSLNPIWE